MTAVDKPVFSVAIRELTEFVLRRGDLGGWGGFVGSDRALAGTRGHQRWQRSRPSGYRKELPVCRDVEGEGLILRVQGRIDGVLTTDQGVVIEEIKTVRGGWDGEADPLHWAQVRMYGFLYAESEGIETLVLQLVYLDLDSDEATEFRECTTRAGLGAFFEETVSVYLAWMLDLRDWRLTRNQTLAAVRFPFPRHRPGQRQIAVATYRTMRRGGRLFLEAPTGIGKTAAVLFPAVKALGEGHVERIYYLTARTVGRRVAEQALAELRAVGMRLRSLTLTARDRICVERGRACDPATCGLASGYYDRRHEAMRDLLHLESVTRTVLEAVSGEHRVCPYELSLDVSTWMDVVICDYNHVFDPRVYLRRHFGEEPGPYGFLIDEAHNLVDRARDMFSAELSSHDIKRLTHGFGQMLPRRCARALNRLDAGLRKLGTLEAGSDQQGQGSDWSMELELFPAETGPGKTIAKGDNGWKRSTARGTAQAHDTLTRPDPPVELLAPVDAALQEMESLLVQNRPAEYRDSLLDFHHRLYGFRRAADLHDERYATIVHTGTGVRVRLFCLDPSFLLRKALDRGRSAVFFSATLTPTDYYRSLLGGSSEDPFVRMPSPFDPARLAVLVHDRVRTDWKNRVTTLEEVARSIGAVVEGQPGNYLVYFPSYQYLTLARDRFEAQHPMLRVRAQRPDMTERERDEFLAAFRSESGATQVGFAVLGGVFGEGIDLVGDRLIGVVVVGVGLPQLCVERDLIRDHFDARTACGFDYAYTFPGMNRVLQATGRVIRSETDCGIVLLLDARFGQLRYRRLFPAWWQPVPVANATDIRSAARGFRIRAG